MASARDEIGDKTVPRIGRWRELFFVLAAALLIRVAFLWLAPEGAISSDLSQNWPEVARVLRARGNPYSSTTFLNWPPLWMQLIALLDGLSRTLGLSFIRVVQCFLIALDLLGMAVAFGLLRALKKPPAIAILIGLGLNPIDVLLVCQHGNFDVLVGLFCLCGVRALIAFHRSSENEDWLLACLFFGMGILAKVVPIALVPLLAHRASRLRLRALGIGAFLLFAPVALGISIIYVLGPEAVARNVFAYRSSAGWFGLSGLIQLAGIGGTSSLYSKVFAIAFLALLIGSSIFFWRTNRAISGGTVALAAALFLLVIPTLGPGYAPQYIGWYLPLLVIAFAAVDDVWLHRVLAAFFAIATMTYLIEYGTFISHGALWLRLFPHAAGLREWSDSASTAAGQTKIRLALFAADLALLITGVRALKKQLD